MISDKDLLREAKKTPLSVAGYSESSKHSTYSNVRTLLFIALTKLQERKYNGRKKTSEHI